MAVEENERRPATAGKSTFAAGAGALPFSPAEIASEMAMMAREAAEKIELAETLLMVRIDPAEAPATHDAFDRARRRARILGCVAEYFQRVKIGVEPVAA